MRANPTISRIHLNRLNYLTHAPIRFYFRQTTDNFVVEEIPLYPFSGSGEHLVLKIRKKNLTTWQMLEILASHTGLKLKEFGYAGLKDKYALTTQYISLPVKYEPCLETLAHPSIKILETFRHGNKIRTGHLKGNRFFIRLKKVSAVDAQKIEAVFKTIEQAGLPNYFGYQRFGIDSRNFEAGRDLAAKQVKARHKKQKFLLNAYQSHLFNLWLCRRVEISTLLNHFDTNEVSTLLNLSGDAAKELQRQKHVFKLLPGDLCLHYPHGRLFAAESLMAESERFMERQIAPTGLLPGERTQRANGLAGEIEKDFDDAHIQLGGDRRYAWIWAEAPACHYKKSEAQMELNFILPKGSYATVLLEMLANRPLLEKDERYPQEGNPE